MVESKVEGRDVPPFVEVIAFVSDRHSGCLCTDQRYYLR